MVKVPVFGKQGMELELFSNEWFDEAFSTTDATIDIPKPIRTAASRICIAYNIKGIADPPYIANVIKAELERKDD